jgi:hypothetical protein
METNTSQEKDKNEDVIKVFEIIKKSKNYRNFDNLLNFEYKNINSKIIIDRKTNEESV